MGDQRLRILGVDPGSNVTGYGVVDQDGQEIRHVAHGTLRPPRSGSLAGRLARIQEGMQEILTAHEPDVAVIECPFVGRNPKTALVLGQARGAALAVLGAAGLSVQEVTPSEIKQAVVGTGRADKRQVQRMVKRLLTLQALPAEDAADALAAALCRAHQSPIASLESQAARRPRPRGRRPSGSFVVRRAR